MAFDRLHHLSPAFGAVEDDGAVKFEGELQLSLEDFAHARRNRLRAQPVETDLANAGEKVWEVWEVNTFQTFLFRFPRVYADEVASDEQLANRRVVAGYMAMCVSHCPPIISFAEGDVRQCRRKWYNIRPMKTKPLFLVLSAPSGCGKSTLIDMILQEYCDIVYSISCTTRAPRGEEEDGLDYHFKTKERFEELIGEGAFIEYAKVHGNYYGTLKQPIEEVLAEGNSMILDIDVQGAAKVRDYVRKLPNTDPLKIGYVDIFINPPSMEELRARLEGRGTDSPEVIEKRLLNAEGEMARAGEYMYRVTNDDLGMCYKRLCDLIDALSGRM